MSLVVWAPGLMEAIWDFVMTLVSVGKVLKIHVTLRGPCWFWLERLKWGVKGVCFCGVVTHYLEGLWNISGTCSRFGQKDKHFTGVQILGHYFLSDAIRCNTCSQILLQPLVLTLFYGIWQPYILGPFIDWKARVLGTFVSCTLAVEDLTVICVPKLVNQVCYHSVGITDLLTGELVFYWVTQTGCRQWGNVWILATAWHGSRHSWWSALCVRKIH